MRDGVAAEVVGHSATSTVATSAAHRAHEQTRVSPSQRLRTSHDAHTGLSEAKSRLTSGSPSAQSMITTSSGPSPRSITVCFSTTPRPSPSPAAWACTPLSRVCERSIISSWVVCSPLIRVLVRLSRLVRDARDARDAVRARQTECRLWGRRGGPGDGVGSGATSSSSSTFFSSPLEGVDASDMFSVGIELSDGVRVVSGRLGRIVLGLRSDIVTSRQYMKIVRP